MLIRLFFKIQYWNGIFCDVRVKIIKSYLTIRNTLHLFVAVKCAASLKVCQEDQLAHLEVTSKHNTKISLFRYFTRTFFDGKT